MEDWRPTKQSVITEVHPKQQLCQSALQTTISFMEIWRES